MATIISEPGNTFEPDDDGAEKASHSPSAVLGENEIHDIIHDESQRFSDHIDCAFAVANRVRQAQEEVSAAYFLARFQKEMEGLRNALNKARERAESAEARIDVAQGQMVAQIEAITPGHGDIVIVNLPASVDMAQFRNINKAIRDYFDTLRAETGKRFIGLLWRHNDGPLEVQCLPATDKHVLVVTKPTDMSAESWDKVQEFVSAQINEHAAKDPGFIRRVVFVPGPAQVDAVQWGQQTMHAWKPEVRHSDDGFPPQYGIGSPDGCVVPNPSGYGTVVDEALTLGFGKPRDQEELVVVTDWPEHASHSMQPNPKMDNEWDDGQARACKAIEETKRNYTESGVDKPPLNEYALSKHDQEEAKALMTLEGEGGPVLD